MNDPAVIDDGSLDDSWVSPRERFLGRMTWVIMAALGLLVFELTAHPSLGVAVFCLKFGFGRLKTAFWLKKIDSNRKRAWACFGFYLASAMLRIGVASIALSQVALIAVELFDDGRPAGAAKVPRLESEMVVSTVLSILGFMFWWMIELGAIVLALVLNVKIWVGSIADRARKSSIWPPSQLYNHWRDDDRNWAKPQIMLFFTFLSSFIIIVTVIAAFSSENGNRKNPNIEYPLCVSAAWFVVAGFLLLIIYYYVKRRILASTPLDCWPLNDPTGDPSLEEF